MTKSSLDHEQKPKAIPKRKTISDIAEGIAQKARMAGNALAGKAQTENNTPTAATTRMDKRQKTASNVGIGTLERYDNLEQFFLKGWTCKQYVFVPDERRSVRKILYGLLQSAKSTSTTIHRQVLSWVGRYNKNNSQDICNDAIDPEISLQFYNTDRNKTKNDLANQVHERILQHKNFNKKVRYFKVEPKKKKNVHNEIREVSTNDFLNIIKERLRKRGKKTKEEGLKSMVRGLDINDLTTCYVLLGQKDRELIQLVQEQRNKFYHKNYVQKLVKGSYSLMHASMDGFEIVMYDYSHSVQLKTNIHGATKTTLCLKNEMVVVFDMWTVHCGAASTMNPNSLVTNPSTRFFLALSPKNGKHGDCAEQDDVVDRSFSLCESPCGVCGNSTNLLDRVGSANGKVVNLSKIGIEKFEVGNVIAGDLEELGWVVLKGIDIHSNQEVNDWLNSKAGKLSNWARLSMTDERRKNRFALDSASAPSYFETMDMLVEKLNVSFFKGRNEEVKYSNPYIMRNVETTREQLPHRDYKQEPRWIINKNSVG